MESETESPLLRLFRENPEALRGFRELMFETCGIPMNRVLHVQEAPPVPGIRIYEHDGCLWVNDEIALNEDGFPAASYQEVKIPESLLPRSWRVPAPPPLS